jgi:hypothetical protein
MAPERRRRATIPDPRDGEPPIAPTLACAALAFPLTLCFVNLVAVYWQYYDIGIDAAANSLTLVFAVAPVMLALFLAAALLLGRAARRGGAGNWGTFFGGCAGMLALFAASFLVQVGWSAGYPGPRRGALLDFLRYYLGQFAR